MGKGSTRRPSSVPPAVEADNWARTFGGKPQFRITTDDLDAFAAQECDKMLAEVKDGMRPFDSAAQ